MIKFSRLLLLLAGFSSAIHSFSQTKYIAKSTQTPPIIDGLSNDTCWNGATWYTIDQQWIPNPQPTTADFSGRFKISWDANKIYVLGEITDDSLSDVHADSLTSYWEDDTFEIFIDENRSGGDHQFTYNAMAYHISKFFDVVDIDSADQAPHTYPRALNVARTRSGNVYTWEVALNVYTDKYVYASANNPKASLITDKIMGFAIAYCDNDGGSARENFIGSEVISASDKNVAYKDASVFGSLQLKGSSISSLNNDYIDNKNLLFFPNPSSQKISFEEEFSVRIFNASGFEVLNQKNTKSVDVSALSSGVYMVEMAKNNKINRQKLMKE